jgi:TIR domain
VWLSSWEIEPGDSIPRLIDAGLENSSVLVFCISKHALESDWARLESDAFRFRDPLNRERRFIPLRLDDAPLRGSLAQFLYIDWRTRDDYEFERLVHACASIRAKSDDHPEDPPPERASLRVGIRHARFDIPQGWVAQSAAKVAEIQATEGDQATVHAALHHPGSSPELIYALTIWSTAMPASMLTSENIPQMVLAAEQHTGLRGVSDVTPVSLDGAAGWLWHLQGVVPGALFGRPQVATMDVHCSEMWASVDAFTAIKMLLTAPRASAHEAADGLATVVFSWQWGP